MLEESEKENYFEIHFLDGYSFAETIAMLSTLIAPKVNFILTRKGMYLTEATETNKHLYIFEWNIYSSKLLRYKYTENEDPDAIISIGVDLIDLKTALTSVKKSCSCSLTIENEDDETFTVTVYSGKGGEVAVNFVNMITVDFTDIEQSPNYSRDTSFKYPVSRFIEKIKAKTTPNINEVIFNFVDDSIRFYHIEKSSKTDRKVKEQGIDFKLTKDAVKKFLKINNIAPPGAVILFNRNEYSFRMEFQTGCYGDLSMDIAVKSQ